VLAGNTAARTLLKNAVNVKRRYILENRNAPNPKRKMNNRSLSRAIRYLSHYRSQAALPYLFMVIATLSQLVIPRLIRTIIDAVTNGVIANSIVPNLGKIPANTLQQILDRLGITQEQLIYNYNNATRLLITAGIAILVFATFRAVFAFLQTFWSEKNSQSVAFDLRNELFSKIQRLSFSYHDQNQTGQLMIRATDDIEKVRLFIGQGLILAAASLLLIVGTLAILFTTNARLTLIVLPILPISLVLFLVFGSVSQPLFVKVQVKLSALNTVLQE
jgi:ATP-binding cassette subfamily B protein